MKVDRERAEKKQQGPKKAAYVKPQLVKRQRLAEIAEGLANNAT